MKVLLTLGFLILHLQVNSQGTDPPHIILLMCDDLGWGDVGFNGAKKAQTPHLDRLASQGIRFTRFYSASPVCSPTRGSCLTGRNPYRYGIPTANAGHMLEEEITLPELLKEAGYTTGHFGKWHLGTLTTEIKDSNRGRPGNAEHYTLPTDHGYDSYFCTEAKVPTYDPMWKPRTFQEDRGESLRYGWEAIADKGQAEAFGTFYWEGGRTPNPLKGDKKPVQENLQGDNSRVIMDRALAFIEKSLEEGKGPFFSVIWLHTPHLPVVADAEHRGLFEELSHAEQLYYGTITAMDEQVGRLWETLEKQGVAGNTLLCFASDNGPENRTPGSSGPFRERKRSLYEGGVRVPAFWVWPEGIPAGLSTDIPAITSDYLPSIVDLLKLSYPSDRILDGKSLVSVWETKENKRNKPIGFLFGTKQSWVTDQYKLVSTDEGKTWELYDLLEDPSEKQNIAERRKNRVRKMKRALNKWKASVNYSAEGKEYTSP